MTERISQRHSICAFLLLLFWLPLARPQDRSKHDDILPPPRATLAPLHFPNLDALEPEVREQLLSFQSSLATLAKDPAITDVRLSEAYGLLGQIYHAYSLPSPALESYANAQRLAPRDFRWAYLLASLDQQQDRLEEAIHHYQIVCQLRPDYLPALVNLGNSHLRLNRLQEARASFTAALRIDKNAAAALYGLGQIALAAKDYAVAVKYFKEALTQAPDANRLHYALAMAYRGLGDLERARAHLAQQGTVGVRIPDPVIDGLQDLIRGERVHLIRGRLAFESLRFAEAAGEFRKALAANPKSVSARVNLGSVLALTGDVKAAEDQFQETLRVEPRNAAAHYNLGLLLANQNRHDEAVFHLQVVVNLNPSDADAHYRLGRELLTAQRPDEALTEFTLAAQADPGNEDALLDQVKLLLRKQQYAQALSRLEQSHALLPRKGRTAIALAYLLATCPRYELRNGTRALELAQLAYSATGSLNHGIVVALALAELGRCSEAAEWQRRLIVKAEQEGNKDLAAKLTAGLQQYDQPGPCRPEGEKAVANPLEPDTRKP